MARILLICFLFTATPALAEPSVTIEDIKTAWEARRAKVQSFEATLKEERLFFQGGFNNARGRDPDLPGDVPREDTTTHLTHKFIVAPNGLRLENEGTLFNATTAKIINCKTTNVMSDQRITRLSDYGQQPDKGRRYQGGIYKNRHGFADMRFAPLDRLVDREIIFHDKEMQQYKIEKQSVMVNDRPCVLLTHGATKMWFDRERDYVLVRRNHKDRYLMEIEYQENNTVGWLPSKWTSTTKGAAPEGTLKHSIKMQLVDINFNKKYPNVLFNLEFPPGTRLYDATLEGLSGKFAMFIVQPDGFRLPAHLAKPKNKKSHQGTNDANTK